MKVGKLSTRGGWSRQNRYFNSFHFVFQGEITGAAKGLDEVVRPYAIRPLIEANGEAGLLRGCMADSDWAAS